MILVEPVLEVSSVDDFHLWPVATDSMRWLPLSGALSQPEVGAAVLRIADANRDSPGTAAPLDDVLRGLLTTDRPIAFGGLRVTEVERGVVLLPGCCSGLEDWRTWHDAVDGTGGFFGHSPTPDVERVGDVVRLTVDTDKDGSPVIETTVTVLRDQLARVEQDLTAFLWLVHGWATDVLPDDVAPVVVAIARALDLPSPVWVRESRG